MNIGSYKKIHCLGIGGIGVSYLARLLLELGRQVTGSDLVDSETVRSLRRAGATIFVGPHKPSHVTRDTDLVIYSNAVEKNNPEVLQAKRLKIPCVSHPEFLGGLMRTYRSIIVTGTHGKSTVTAMLAKIFIAAGLDPTVAVGTKIAECDGGNARLGLGKYFIAEGDEYRGAFLYYAPTGLIINNIEAEHLDYYKNEGRIVQAFRRLAKKVPEGGFIVANAQDENVRQAIRGLPCRVITFGLGHGDYFATHVVQHGELTRFAIKGLERFDVAIRVPGLHNVSNALAACVMALAFGVEHETIQKALLEYRGAWRRFEIKGEKKGVVVVDDYAHHPTEIKATLAAARQYFPKRRIWCIFQPHSLDRTRRLFNDFVQSFQDCDKLVLTDIYRVAGRDEGKIKVSGPGLARAIEKTERDVVFITDYRKISSTVARQLTSGDVVITMGAGTVTAVSDELLRLLDK